jgi:UDP-glucose 4-epimerase
MRILVTGSSGHLGEALVRTLREGPHEAVGIDLLPSPFTRHTGSIADPAFVDHAMQGVDAVLHTATLHKPHVHSHTRQDFIDTNVTGTLNLLEAAVRAGVRAFVYTSTTSAFGRALSPAATEPAAWITEAVRPVPKNIYGVTKVAAEDLCELMHRLHGLPCLVLRTSRFFPEGDDLDDVRAAYDDANAKLNEFLHRRVAIEDVVEAHLRAVDRAPALGFDRFIVSATSPFTPGELASLRSDAAAVLARHVPGYATTYARHGWRMFPGIDRVYVNTHARERLGWHPRDDFRTVLARLEAEGDWRGPLARQVGAKGYHAPGVDGGPYTPPTPAS